MIFPPSLSTLFLIYGIFLILCGITAVSFIGLKAKTALISGGTSGIMAILTSWLYAQQHAAGMILGLFICSGLLVIFSWRSTKTLFALITLIQDKSSDAKGKAIAFLIISTMAVMTLFTLSMQILFLRS